MPTGPRAAKLRPPDRLGPDDTIGEGDSHIVYASNNSPDSSSRTLAIHHARDVPDIYAVKDEVHWQKMYHASGEVPRLVCCQGQYEADYSMPVYRHPSDQSLPLLHYSPLVKQISEHVACIVGHPVNHCLIQLYRGGQDFISEHSDKTLDVVRGSSIVNVSLGAERAMRLRTKKVRGQAQDLENDGCAPRKTQVVPMPNGSIFVLGPKTNMVWLHGINPDKRPDPQRSEVQKAFGGERISLTFRYIGTFLDPPPKLIWGQGARSKSREEAGTVVSGDETYSKGLLMAFGAENRSSDFDWDVVYGAGFDVLNFKLDPSDGLPLVFYSGDQRADSSVRKCLKDYGIEHKVAGVAIEEAGTSYQPTVCYRDDDEAHTQTLGDNAILHYLKTKQDVSA